MKIKFDLLTRQSKLNPHEFQQPIYAPLGLIVILCLLLISCTSLTGKQPISLTQPNQSHLADLSDNAIVYFYRQRSSLAGVNEEHPPNIFMNEKLVGALPNGSFKATILSELENKTISIKRALEDQSLSNVIIEHDMNFSGATSYYIKLKQNKSGEAEMVVVDEATALKEMRKLKAVPSGAEYDRIIN